MTNGRPFNDIRDLVATAPEPDAKAMELVATTMSEHGDSLQPLGRGTHGVTSQIFDQDIIQAAHKRVKNMTEGQAGVRGIAEILQSAYKVYELGLDYPSESFTQTASLSEKDCAAAIAFGMEVVAEGANVIALGNVGFGAATAAAGITRGLYGGAAEYWAGGTGEVAKARGYCWNGWRDIGSAPSIYSDYFRRLCCLRRCRSFA